MSELQKEKKWFVVEFKEINEKTNEVNVFYNAVPDSWIKFGKKPTLSWSLALSCSKDIMLGLPPKAPIVSYDCKLVSGEFENFKEAHAKEIKIFNEKREKSDLTTTEMESEEEDGNTEDNTGAMDLNKLATELLKNEEAISLSETEEKLNGFDSNYQEIIEQHISSNAPNTKLNILQNYTIAAPIEDDSGKPTMLLNYREPVASNSENSSIIPPVSRETSDATTFLNEIPIGTIIDGGCCCYSELKVMIEELLRITKEHQSTLSKLCVLSTPKAKLDKQLAKGILVDLGIQLPITNEQDLNTLEYSLQQKNKSVSEALESVLFHETSGANPIRKNFKASMDVLIDCHFAASTFTTFGTANKTGFVLAYKQIVQAVESVIIQRHSGVSSSDVQEEIKHFFKYVGQTSSRLASKAASKSAFKSVSANK